MGIFDSESSVTVDPYKPAKPFLDDTIRRIGALDTPEYWEGDLTAGMTPGLRRSLDEAYGFGGPGGMGGMSADLMYGTGADLMGAYGGAQDFMTQMAGRGAPQFQYDQATYDQVMENLAGDGMQQYFDVGARNINQGFDWNVLPGLKMDAAMAGRGGTRGGQATALADAMRANQVQQFGTNLWQGASDRANMAAMTGGSQNLAAEQNYRDQMMRNYMGMGGAGAGLVGTGYDMGVGNIGLGMQAGQFDLGYDQQALDREIARHMYGETAPWQYEQQRLNSLMSPASAFSTTTQSHSPGIGNIALQGAMAYMMGGGGLPGVGGGYDLGAGMPGTGGYEFDFGQIPGWG